MIVVGFCFLLPHPISLPLDGPLFTRPGADNHRSYVFIGGRFISPGWAEIYQELPDCHLHVAGLFIFPASRSRVPCYAHDRLRPSHLTFKIGEGRNMTSPLVRARKLARRVEREFCRFLLYSIVRLILELMSEIAAIQWRFLGFWTRSSEFRGHMGSGGLLLLRQILESIFR